jgi:hypothetical protein
LSDGWIVNREKGIDLGGLSGRQLSGCIPREAAPREREAAFFVPSEVEHHLKVNRPIGSRRGEKASRERIRFAE